MDKLKHLDLDQSPRCSLCACANEEPFSDAFCVDCMHTLCEQCIPKHNPLLDTHTELMPCYDLQLPTILKKRPAKCQELDMFLIRHYEDYSRCTLASVVDEGRDMIYKCLKKVRELETFYDELTLSIDKAQNTDLNQLDFTKRQTKEHCAKLIKQIEEFNCHKLQRGDLF